MAPTVVAVASDLELPVTVDDLALPTEPASPAAFTALVDRYGLGGSAERVVKSLAAQR